MRLYANEEDQVYHFEMQHSLYQIASHDGDGISVSPVRSERRWLVAVHKTGPDGRERIYLLYRQEHLTFSAVK